MKISQYLKKEFCVMNLKSETKEEAIREIVSVLDGPGKIRDKDKFIEDILEREQLGSTGIGHNVAIPHARTDVIEGFVIGMGRSEKGIDFNSIDGKKAHIIFLMGASTKELNLYLRLLAELSKLLMSFSFREQLMSAHSSEEVLEVFERFEK